MFPRLLLFGVLSAALVVGGGGQPAQRRTVSLLVTNGIVVTVDGNRRVMPRGAVAIDGRDIVSRTISR